MNVLLTMCGKGDLVGMTRLRTWRWRGYPGLPGRLLCCDSGSRWERQEQESQGHEVIHAGLEWCEAVCWKRLEKRKDWIFPGATREYPALLSLFRPLIPRTRREYICFVLGHSIKAICYSSQQELIHDIAAGKCFRWKGSMVSKSMTGSYYI